MTTDSSLSQQNRFTFNTYPLIMSSYLSKSSDGLFQNIIFVGSTNTRNCWAEWNVRERAINYLKSNEISDWDEIFPYGNNYSIRNAFSEILADNEVDEKRYKNTILMKNNSAADNRIFFSIIESGVGSSYNDNTIQLNYNQAEQKARIQPLYFKRIYLGTDYKLYVLFFGPYLSTSISKDETFYLQFLIYNGGSSWNYMTDFHYWNVYYNIPSSITDNMGCNVWVTKDMKWMFCVGKGNFGGAKGLNTVKSVKAMFNDTGWAGVTYYQNDNSTSELRTTLANYYVLEIQFNKNSDKMIVLCNDKKGVYGEYWGSDTYYLDGIQPTHLFCFFYNKSSDVWKTVSNEIVGISNFWNTYNSSGNQGDAYRPFFHINLNYSGNFWDMSYVFPSYSSNRKGYYAQLTFGD